MELVIIQIIVAFIAIKLDDAEFNNIEQWAIYLLPFIGLLLAGLMIIIDLMIIAEKKIKGERNERVFR